ncbi:MAG: formylglycine-generating enzyme family protein [Symploca sp. SIO2E6]|nr:formylglycine-generating enzyme family protein [Symploca sp. SIO2E6]
MFPPRLAAFNQRFGQAYLDLACHAAFPLALTPELLYCLRENFQPRCDWLAVADILLSLCDPVGYELYELEPEVRNELLLTLKNHCGEERLQELSEFMIAYIRQELPTNYRVAQDLGAAPHWTALAYTKPEQAIADIAQVVKAALETENPSEWVKLTPLLESFANFDPLLESGFEPLLILTRGWDAKAQGEEETAAEEFRQLGKTGEQREIAGVFFEIPPSGDKPTFTLEKSTLTFEVVQVNAGGEEISRTQGQAEYFTEDLGNGIILQMVAIPGGSFQMGYPATEEGHYSDEESQHEVTVPSFFMGRYPVTQAQWQAVARLPQVKRRLDPNPSYFQGVGLPVEKVSWYDAVEFCARLSRKTGREYRLPSEAEWEYACRAGTTTPFHFGATITTDLANYDGNSTYGSSPQGQYRQQTTPVGSFAVANAFGLFDLHGNVWEWCADTWHDNYQGAPRDGSAWQDDNDNDNHSRRLARGGAWGSHARNCRAAFRVLNTPEYGHYNVGFRCVCRSEGS